MKTLLFLISLICIVNINAQNVDIPDANFKAYLVGNKKINTNSDTEIQVSEAVTFRDSIDCSLRNISNLKGIEAFTNLIYLWCNENQLTSLDVSKNTVLKTLQCQGNQLKCLNGIPKNCKLYGGIRCQ